MNDEERNQKMLEHYKNNQLLYDSIEQQLQNVRTIIETAPEPIAETVLFMADTYALISANTKVEAHEIAFTRVVDKRSYDDINAVLTETRARKKNWSVMYPNNKTDYIIHNMQSVDYSTQLDLYRAGKFDELHRMKVDDVQGIAIRKAAFSLAMSGVTEKMCIDSNVARYFGLNPDEDVYDGVVVDRYENQCKELRERSPALTDEVSNYLWQWVCFDLNREQGITTHDPWFMTIESETSEPVMG